jgi:uncharacterized membrane protein YecN with MAPEG domain
MNWVTAVMLLAIVEFLVFSFLVGFARTKYKVPAPAITGDENFERYFRVHQNTLEQLIVFLPACWFFANTISAKWAAVLGVVFIIGRAVYAAGYIKAPQKRSTGFGLTFLPNIILLVGALIGTVKAALTAG